jgi:hypothetical protein
MITEDPQALRDEVQGLFDFSIVSFVRPHNRDGYVIVWAYGEDHPIDSEFIAFETFIRRFDLVKITGRTNKWPELIVTKLKEAQKDILSRHPDPEKGYTYTNDPLWKE